MATSVSGTSDTPTLRGIDYISFETPQGGETGGILKLGLKSEITREEILQHKLDWIGKIVCATIASYEQPSFPVLLSY